jgi:hypothetical protein
MNRRILAAALVAASLAAAGVALAAQSTTQPSQPQPDRFAVTIEGCVRGNVLTPTRTGGSRAQSEILTITEYQLRGSRALMRALRDGHDGHTEELAGTVELPRERQVRAGVLTKETGKGRIVVGRRENRTLPETDIAARPATLTIDATRHVADNCSDR